MTIDLPFFEPKLNGNCDICNIPISITMCCSGRDCGCMGMPTEIPVCSEKCEKEYMKRQRIKNLTAFKTWQKKNKDKLNSE